MKISEIMKGVSTEEQNRRMEAVGKMNKLWIKKQACEDKTEIKRIEKKISQIASQERFWMKDFAFFLY